ncbi:MAG TPA: VWA domain-containing protein [Verrucomicrobiae bacterium]|jgi:VWFA-related protein|nr:VWA domain-containing protein [Verrucomicrobiae bacterium]
MGLLRPLRLFLAGTLLALGAILAAQDRPSSPPPAGDAASQEQQSTTSVPVIRSTANLVVVDVVVNHDGHPVKGLQQAAFHIFEDGREQTIKAFEEHGPGIDGPKTDKPSPLPPNTYSNIPEPSTASAINVLLLDAVNTPMEDQAYARHKIIEYLKTIPPGTRMAVFTLASRLRLVQGFTTDSTVLLAALNRSVPMQSLALSGNKGESAEDRFSALGVGQSPLGQSPMGQSTMDSVLASLRQFEADEEGHLIDRRVQITLDALKQLALYLGAVPGRKNVIWFSASFPLSLAPESPLDPFKSQRGYGAQLQQVSDLLTTSRVAVYPIDARGLIVPPPPPRQTRPAGVALSGPGMRTGMIDQSAFPSAPEASDRTNAELATMLQLAEETGGTPFYNSNALKQGLARAIENGSSYYTVTYSPENKKFDGRLRKIQVKLTGHNDHLAYRRGYFADAPAAHSAKVLLGMGSPGLLPDAPPSSQVFFHARIFSAGDPAAQDLQPQAGPAGDLAARLKPPVTRYWIEYTADMNHVSAEVDAKGLYRSTIEFIAIAYDHDGKVVNASRRVFRLGMPPAKYDEILQTGYSVRNEIDLPDGEVRLRLAVHDVSADRVGSIEVPLRVLARKPD